MYDHQLTRYVNRPGIRLQNWLNNVISVAGVPRGSEVVKILEIGSGVGQLARRYLSAGYAYDAVEPTKSMREIVSKWGKEFPSFGEIYSEKLPSKHYESLHNQYSHIVAVHMIEHFESPYIAHQALDQALEMLLPGGRIFVLTPDYLDYGKLFFDIDWSHCFPLTASRLEELLLDCGFEEVKIQTWRGPFKSAIPKALLWFISKLIPNKIFDSIFLKIFGHKLLASGFMVGFIKRNIVATGIKPHN